MSSVIAVKCFIRDESGAVTTDWVMLTAAVVGLGLLTSSSSIFDLRGALIGGGQIIAAGADRAATSGTNP